MMEVDPSSVDQKQEVGAVLGHVLYHALLGHCFSGQTLPDESFFLDYHCFTAEELVRIYNLSEESSGMGRTGVATLSPALVQQILSGSCLNMTEPETPNGPSKSDKYLYATLANVIITVMAMLGIVMLLCTSCANVFQMCIQFCISMAVGSLTGDALLHLVPMVGDFNTCKVAAKGII
ncbi:hypothetical protein GOODEAATRI_014433 [Goodea atripinnis]|uniref:Zinc transporter ZIP4/12 EF-hand domain-containing protein n=1 Tax=Goodea atripinnis TaxID=208336 RepID=A0ABV0P5K2_9TELE